MMKYIIIVCVAAFTLLIGGRSFSHNEENSIECAVNMGTDSKIAQGQKIESQDSVFGPVNLPEVSVIMKKKVTKVI